MTKQRLTEKSRVTLITVALLLLWLIFGSSINILSPSNAKLGVLFGCLFSLVAILAPIYYVKFSGIKIKNPKPLYVEPSPWRLTPILLISSVLIFFGYITVLALAPSPLNFLVDELDKDNFLGNSLIFTILFTSLFGPITIFFVYTRTCYKRVIEYNSVEWKKIKLKNQLPSAPHK